MPVHAYVRHVILRTYVGLMRQMYVEFSCRSALSPCWVDADKVPDGDKGIASAALCHGIAFTQSMSSPFQSNIQPPSNEGPEESMLTMKQHSCFSHTTPPALLGCATESLRQHHPLLWQEPSLRGC